MMPMPTTTSTAGLVRPRYQDVHVHDPLPLEDLALEQVIAAPTPGRLALLGARGGGLTTTLDCLRGLARDAGRRPLEPGELAGARADLDSGEAVLFIDLSPGLL